MKAALTLLTATFAIITATGRCCCCYAPHLRAKVASSIAKGERREHERRVVHRVLCERCHRPTARCVCHALPETTIRIPSTDTDVLILQHPGEFRRKTISTVPLIRLVLENAHLCVGHSFEVDQVAPIRDAISKGHRLLMLFLGPGALSLDEADSWSDGVADSSAAREGFNPGPHLDDSPETPGRRNLLILIDGTWTQARSMARNSPSLLQRCHKVQFTSSELSEECIYDALRKEPEGHYLSTLEACAKALPLLEPNETARARAGAASDHMLAALRSLVDTQLAYTMGNNNGTKSSLVPRYANREEKALKRKRRRAEIERDFFHAGGARTSPFVGDPTRRRQQQVIMDLGDGAKMRPLVPSDAAMVNSRWPFRSAKSLTMIHSQIEADTGLGGGACCLGIERDGELCASILRYRNGALGILHVEDSYRRRGFGSLLLAEAARVLEARGEPCFAFILDGNNASEMLFQKQGWARADPNAKRGTGKRRAKRKWIKD